MVIKSDNRLEPFDKEKIRRGIIRACKKRPISTEKIDKLVNDLEYELQDYVLEVPSFIIGEKVLGKLYKMDPIAYIRFASVYKKFQDVNVFIEELEKLKNEISKAGGIKKEEPKSLRIKELTPK